MAATDKTEIVRDALAAGGAAAGAAIVDGKDAITVLLQGGAGALAAVGAHAAPAIVSILETPQGRMLALESELKRATEQARPQLEPKLQELIESGVPRETLLANSVSVYSAWGRAYANASDDKKRRLLMAALVNAFDKEAYEEGLTVSLLRIIDELDYPEIYTLRCIRAEGVPEERARYPATLNGSRSTLGRWHLDRLRDRGLLWWHAIAERNDAVLKGAIRTELGDRVLKLIGDGAFEGETK